MYQPVYVLFILVTIHNYIELIVLYGVLYHHQYDYEYD